MKVGILGGGISGLSAAYYLARNLKNKKLPYEIIVLESNKRVGGWMNSKKQNGAIFEQGPRSIRTAGFVGKHTLKLIQDIGLTDEIIPVDSSHTAAKTRIIYAKNKLHVLPNSLWTGFQHFEPINSRLIPKAVVGYIKPVMSDIETMYDVCNYKFGEDFTNYLVDPFVRGVFAADIRQLSMKAAFPPVWNILANRKNPAIKPQLQNEEKELKSLNNEAIVQHSLKNKWTQWSFVNGIQSFPEALEKYCNENFNIKIIKNAFVESLSQNEDKKLKINFQKGGDVNSVNEIDHVISALSSPNLSQLLSSSKLNDENNTMENVQSMLNEIKFVDVGVVNVEFDGKASDNLPIVGFGHLVPSCENSNVLGVIYDSCSFPQHDRQGTNTTRLTCMMGGSWFNELFGEIDEGTESKLENSALTSLAQQLNITKDPVSMNVTIAKNAIPTYQVGHLEKMKKLVNFIAEKDVPLSLAGSSYWGVSINDCIYNSHIVADKFCQDICN